MGLLDELAGKSFDEATSSFRGRRERRAAARDLLVSELRTYSEQIERMRIALINLIECLRRTDFQESARSSARELLLAVARSAEPSPADVDQACDDLLTGLPLSQAEWSAIQVFLRDQIERQLFGSANLTAMRLAERSAREREELELAWARVRPLLDDLVEIRVVMAMRTHRHDLRSRIEYAMWEIARLEQTPLTSPELGPQVGGLVEVLTDVVRFADAWNLMVGKVRGDIGRLRRS